jgi:hypothetical protein
MHIHRCIANRPRLNGEQVFSSTNYCCATQHTHIHRCIANRPRLKKIKSTLEFQLRLQAFVGLFCPMIVGLFCPYIRSLLTLMHTTLEFQLRLQVGLFCRYLSGCRSLLPAYQVSFDTDALPQNLCARTLWRTLSCMRASTSGPPWEATATSTSSQLSSATWGCWRSAR